jgi:hypothetical protein
MSNMKRYPIYVWCLTLYPILFLYAHNIQYVFVDQVLLSIGVALAAITGVFGAAWSLTKDTHRAGAIAAIITLCVFTYGHIFSWIDSLLPLPSTVIVVFPLYAFLTALGLAYFGLRPHSSQPARSAAQTLNIISLILLLMPTAEIAFVAFQAIMKQSTASVQASTMPPKVMDSADHPDIYYIILDGYSSNAHLLRDYDYDNSAFTDGLEQRGFYVAYDSRTNYGVTLPSLATALNMRYLDQDDEAAAQGDAVSYTRRMIADSEVARMLQLDGYTYIYMLAGATGPSSISDENIDFFPTGPRTLTPDEIEQSHAYNTKRDFAPLLASTTIIRYVLRIPERVESDRPYNFDAPQRALEIFDTVETVAARPEATFTFVHIIKPHDPIVFDAQGGILAHNSFSSDAATEAAFFDQLQFINQRTLAMLDQIIAGSDTPPVIIIQGDHGTNLGQVLSPDSRPIYFEILNAYRFPGHEDCLTDPAITPVNSFRVLFNCYFGGHYPMLDNHHFELLSHYQNIFNMREIDIVQWQRDLESP